MNLLGNCSLLEKNFNIVKSDKSFWSFLQQVEGFDAGQRADWEASLGFRSVMTEPDETRLAAVIEAIRERDAAMRRELIEFVKGNLVRKDLDD